MTLKIEEGGGGGGRIRNHEYQLLNIEIQLFVTIERFHRLYYSYTNYIETLDTSFDHTITQ